MRGMILCQKCAVDTDMRLAHINKGQQKCMRCGRRLWKTGYYVPDRNVSCETEYEKPDNGKTYHYVNA